MSVSIVHEDTLAGSSLGGDEKYHHGSDSWGRHSLAQRNLANDVVEFGFRIRKVVHHLR